MRRVLFITLLLFLSTAAFATQGVVNPVEEATGVVSIDNSSAISLPIAGTFVGDAESIVDVAIIYLTVYSDEAGTLVAEQSTDGTNWDHSDTFEVLAADGGNFSVNPHAEFFRVAYTNGAVAQTEFRLQVIYKSVYGKPSSHAIESSLNDTDDAELVKAIITGKDENGDYQNVRTNSDGLLEITDFFIEVAKGNIPGHTKVAKFGENNSVGSTIETIWDAGGLYPWATWDASGPIILQIQSTLAADDLAGTGAQTIQIEGLGSDWSVQAEIIEMDGVTPVDTLNEYRRLHRMVVVTAGTARTALGTITAENGGVVVAQIINGNNQTLMAVYTVPLGKTGYVVFGKTSCGKAADAKVKFFARPPGGVFNVQHTANLFQNSYDYPFAAIPAVTEMTDMDVRATTTNPSGYEVTMAFDTILVDD